jgi:hypothetical protein
MDLSLNFLKIRKKIKIDTQIHTQKIIFFLILNYLFRKLQEICKILKLKLKLKTQILRKLKTQTQTQTFEYFRVHMSVHKIKLNDPTTNISPSSVSTLSF